MRQSDRTIRRASAAAGVAFAAELAVTALLMTVGTSSVLLVLHVAAAALLWSTLVVIGVRAMLPVGSMK
jgi:hypothetical protein